MTYFYIYKITLTEGKLKDYYYIGQHKTNGLNDGYKGSGVIIQKYYKKHPNGYKKEILEWCGNESDMNYYEDYFIGDKYETDPLCLNLCAGGHQQGVSEETSKKLSEAMKGKTSPMKNKHHSKETLTKMSEAHKGKNHHMYGKHHSKETVKKMSESLKGKTSPNKGKHWKLIDGKRVYY